jgi:hypothetical protein
MELVSFDFDNFHFEPFLDLGSLLTPILDQFMSMARAFPTPCFLENYAVIGSIITYIECSRDGYGQHQVTPIYRGPPPHSGFRFNIDRPIS